MGINKSRVQILLACDIWNASCNVVNGFIPYKAVHLLQCLHVPTTQSCTSTDAEKIVMDIVYDCRTKHGHHFQPAKSVVMQSLKTFKCSSISILNDKRLINAEAST